MPDYNRSITVEDLLRRYNLEGLQRDRNRVYQLQGELTNTNGILEDFVDVTTQNMDQIKDQLDGNVTSWFYGYVPTWYNVPAVNWVTEEQKREHLEDLFYNTDTGRVYKYTNTDPGTELFDPDNAHQMDVNSTYYHGLVVTYNGLGEYFILKSTNDYIQAVYIPCTPNITYTASADSQEYFYVATTSTVDFGEGISININQHYTLNNYETTAKEVTFKTKENDNYIVMIFSMYHHLETLDDIIQTISITSQEGDWGWKEVTNIVGAQTLAVANASQDILDGNRRTFVVQPTPPYDVGDLWTDNTNHILYRCRTEKAADKTFSMDDWVDSLKYLTNDGDVIIDSINSSKTTKTVQAKHLFIAGDEIDLTGKTISITSDNFQVDSEGNMTCRDGTFRGYVTLYDADKTQFAEEVFTIFGDVNGHTSSNIMSSTSRTLQLDQGSYGADLYEFCNETEAGVVYNFDLLSKTTRVSSNGISTTGTVSSTNGICQGSLKELKTDFKELPSGLDIIRDIDIYKYKYKDQDGDKDHIGFVIADDYNYSKEVTNDKNDGVDLYSFVSVCCKAIQEQQKEIEELKEEINKLKKEE